jgi:hypothetical protein
LKLQKDFLYLPNTAAYAAEIIMAFRFSAVFQFSVQLTFVKRESHPPTPKQLQLYKAIHSPLSVRSLFNKNCLHVDSDSKKEKI